VYAVHTHLKRLGIATDLAHSDSWNAPLRALFHPADLLLPNVGKLECCPVLPGQTHISLPDAIAHSIGFVAVQFGESLDTVQLTGFISTADIPEGTVEWAIANLHPFDSFLDCLPELAANPLVTLRDWFQHRLTTGWQTLESLLDTEPVQFAFGFRGVSSVPTDETTHYPESNVSACKVIDFDRASTEQLTTNANHKLDKLRLVLVMHLSSTVEAIDISVRICPMDQQFYLPADLQVAVWDQAGTLIQADTRHANNWIQLEFSGQPGERFQLKVAIGEVSITEEFLI
jgi:hypothetical protein